MGENFGGDIFSIFISSKKIFDMHMSYHAMQVRSYHLYILIIVHS
jgi:hypothetical protein